MDRERRKPKWFEEFDKSYVCNETNESDDENSEEWHEARKFESKSHIKMGHG